MACLWRREEGELSNTYGKTVYLKKDVAASLAEKCRGAGVPQAEALRHLVEQHLDEVLARWAAAKKAATKLLRRPVKAASS